MNCRAENWGIVVKSLHSVVRSLAPTSVLCNLVTAEIIQGSDETTYRIYVSVKQNQDGIKKKCSKEKKELWGLKIGHQNILKHTKRLENKIKDISQKVKFLKSKKTGERKVIKLTYQSYVSTNRKSRKKEDRNGREKNYQNIKENQNTFQSQRTRIL